MNAIPRLLNYYTDRINIYESDLFVPIPAVAAPPAPPVMYIHRTTNTGNPYPVPWYGAGHIGEARGLCRAVGQASAASGCGGYGAGGSYTGIPVTVPYPTSGCTTCCGGGGC